MKLLVTGAWKCTETQLNEIKGLGHDVVFMQNESDGLPCAYETVEGVICNGLFLHHPIEKFTALRYIQLTSAGLDRVPMEYIRAHNITIHNAKGVYGVPMAEFALCGVLQLYKQSRFFQNNQKQKLWIKNRDVMELFGKNVCIVGCGDVGTECAKRFHAFACAVTGIDLYPRMDERYEQMLPLSEFENVLPSADVVVLTLPLTETTQGFMNEKRFGFMKNGSVFVNISRGGVVDEQALLKALDEKLFGAVLDVFSVEPLPTDSPLWGKGNAIIIPHNSFIGDGNEKRLFQKIYQNLVKV